MKRLLTISSYAFVAALGAVFALAIHHGGNPDALVQASPACTPVIISEFGGQKLYRDQVCSNEDLARIYGETRLREQEWTSSHDCDVDTGDAPDMMKMRWKR